MFPSAPSRGRECKGREGHPPQMCPGLRNLYDCWSRGGGPVFHPSHSYPLSQSTPTASVPTTTSTHGSSGTLADQPKFTRLLFALTVFCVTFFVLWVLWFMDWQEAACVRVCVCVYVCVCVIAWLQSGLERGTSIIHPEAVTKISIHFLSLEYSGSPKLWVS